MILCCHLVALKISSGPVKNDVLEELHVQTHACVSEVREVGAQRGEQTPLVWRAGPLSVGLFPVNGAEELKNLRCPEVSLTSLVGGWQELWLAGCGFV